MTIPGVEQVRNIALHAIGEESKFGDIGMVAVGLLAGMGLSEIIPTRESAFVERDHRHRDRTGERVATALADESIRVALSRFGVRFP